MSQVFTPRDFVELAKELSTHEAELKIKLAKAGILEQAARENGPSDGRPA